MKPTSIADLLTSGRVRLYRTEVHSGGDTLNVADKREVALYVTIGSEKYCLRVPLDLLTVESLGSVSVPKPRPWEENSDWLSEKYQAHGSFPAIVASLGLETQDAKAMHIYARNILGWRIEEGVQLLRWEFVRRYYAQARPDLRPKLREVARQLGVSASTLSAWRKEIETGHLFNQRFTAVRWREALETPPEKLFPGDPARWR